MTQYKLTYFDSRGLAEPSRLVLSYAGATFEDNRINQETWNELKAKYTWGVAPVLEFDGKVLGQSSAILRYLAKRYNLAGENDFEAAKCDEMVEAMGDLKKTAFTALFEKDEAKQAELVVTIKSETIPKFLTQWNKAVVANGGFLVGKKFTYADFAIASYLDIFNDHFGGNIFDNFPALKSHSDSVFSAKGIKEWVAKRPKTKF